MITGAGHTEMPLYYNCMDLIAVPSRTVKSWKEQFGRVIIEAMACGTPVVASKVGGLAVLINDGQTGFSIPPNQIKPLTKSISLLLQNKKLKAEMGRSARRAALKYAWPKIIPRIINCYQALI